MSMQLRVRVIVAAFDWGPAVSLARRTLLLSARACLLVVGVQLTGAELRRRTGASPQGSARVGNCPAVWRTRCASGDSGTLPDAFDAGSALMRPSTRTLLLVLLGAGRESSNQRRRLSLRCMTVEWGGGAQRVACGCDRQLFELVLWDRLFDEREDLLFLEPEWSARRAPSSCSNSSGGAR